MTANGSPDFLRYPFEKHGLEVSRETREKFSRYAALLLKWQRAINLVSATTLEEMAERHFLDSLQLMRFIPPASGSRTWDRARDFPVLCWRWPACVTFT
jgi:16S rRNA (guanine527-N7)-methyltransferase